MPYTDQLIPEIPAIEAEIKALTTRLNHLRRLLRLARDAELLRAPATTAGTTPTPREPARA